MAVAGTSRSQEIDADRPKATTRSSSLRRRPAASPAASIFPSPSARNCPATSAPTTRCRCASTSRLSTRPIDIVGAPELLVTLSVGPAAGQHRGPAVRRPSGRCLGTHLLRRAQPDAPQLARISRAAGAGRNHHCPGRSRPVRLSRAGRPSAARRRFERLLADDLALARAGPARTVGGDAGSAGAAAGAGRRSQLPRTRRRASPWAIETIRADQFRAPCRARRRRPEPSTLRIVDDFGEVRDLDHGLVNGSMVRETLDDPSRRSACRRAARRTGRRRCREADGRCARRASPTMRVRRGKLPSHRPASKPIEGEALVFERDFDEKVPRDLTLSAHRIGPNATYDLRHDMSQSALRAALPCGQYSRHKKQQRMTRSNQQSEEPQHVKRTRIPEPLRRQAAN